MSTRAPVLTARRLLDCLPLDTHAPVMTRWLIPVLTVSTASCAPTGRAELRENAESVLACYQRVGREDAGDGRLNTLRQIAPLIRRCGDMCAEFPDAVHPPICLTVYAREIEISGRSLGPAVGAPPGPPNRCSPERCPTGLPELTRGTPYVELDEPEFHSDCDVLLEQCRAGNGCEGWARECR